MVEVEVVVVSASPAMRKEQIGLSTSPVLVNEMELRRRSRPKLLLLLDQLLLSSSSSSLLMLLMLLMLSSSAGVGRLTKPSRYDPYPSPERGMGMVLWLIRFWVLEGLRVEIVRRTLGLSEGEEDDDDEMSWNGDDCG